MTEAKYRAIVRKLQAAYEALLEADEHAEYFDAETLGRAMSALRMVPDRLRVQVCDRCNSRGYYEKEGDPFRSYGCDHPEILPLTVGPVK